jgi:hypothetical protein
MVKFKLDGQHEYEDSIRVEITAEEQVPGSCDGVQTVIVAGFFMTRAQYEELRKDADEWFSMAGEG